MWVVLAIAVVLVIAGWLWWRRAGATSVPTGRRATDDEIATTMEPNPVPIVPPPSGAGVPIVPIVPTIGPDGSSDERGGPLPDEPGGESEDEGDERT